MEPAAYFTVSLAQTTVSDTDLVVTTEETEPVLPQDLHTTTSSFEYSQEPIQFSTIFKIDTYTFDQQMTSTITEQTSSIDKLPASQYIKTTSMVVFLSGHNDGLMISKRAGIKELGGYFCFTQWFKKRKRFLMLR